MNRCLRKNIRHHVIQHRIHPVVVVVVVVIDNFNLVVIPISNGRKRFRIEEREYIRSEFCRGSGQNSRTSSVAESAGVNSEGFSNYTEIIQHLQTGQFPSNQIQPFISVVFFLLQFGIVITMSMKVLVESTMMNKLHPTIPKVMLTIINNNHIIINIPAIKIGRIIIILVDQVEIRIILVAIMVPIMMDIGILKAIVFLHIVLSIV